MQACHQIIGSFADRDAVGSHTVQVQQACRALGLDSEIYALHVADGNAQPARSLEELPDDDGATLLLYQASASTPAAEVARARPEPLIVNYHNVTPPSFFAPWEPGIARELLEARAQIRSLARRAVGGLADSAYNAAELTRMGCPKVEVVPVLLDADRLPEPGATERIVAPDAGGSRWLFVGRLCPNKAQHDVIKSFALHRRLFDPGATLTLVGRSSSHRYESALHALVADLGIGDAVEFAGSVPDDELGRRYRGADVYVCLSDHEGFCNTVVEAMAAGTPVVAYASSALPETVRDGGILLDDKDPLRVATAVRRVLTDDALRGALVAAGRDRAAALSIAAARTRFEDAIRQVLGR